MLFNYFTQMINSCALEQWHHRVKAASSIFSLFNSDRFINHWKISPSNNCIFISFEVLGITVL